MQARRNAGGPAMLRVADPPGADTPHGPTPLAGACGPCAHAEGALQRATAVRRRPEATGRLARTDFRRTMPEAVQSRLRLALRRAASDLSAPLKARQTPPMRDTTRRDPTR